MEPLLVWTLVAVAVAALLGRSRSPASLPGPRPRLSAQGRASLVLAAALLAATVAGQARWATRLALREGAAARVHATVPQADATMLPGRGYVSSDGCGACHPSQYASWRRSYHRTMTQPATAAAVLAPFAGERLTADDGHSYRLERDHDELWVDISGVGRRRLGLMTGSHHMQAYWLPGEHGNEQLEFPFTYLLEDRRWVPRRDVFLVGQEYSKAPSRWNRICIECHVTGGQPRVDERSDATASRAAELGIACEACHGPAAAHVAANRSPWRRLGLHLSGAADTTIANPARLASARVSEVCGQCHGIGCPPQEWMQDGIRYRPGQSLQDSKPILQLATLKESNCRRQIAADASFGSSRYWSDGMVRISGREYNGLIGSPCYQRGTMTCLSCHSMHDSEPDRQLARDRDGNAACTQCHRDKAANVAAHTHHRAESSGSSCYNCHMPHTTYGLLRAMRSHQISVPRVQDTLATGRPNACNGCHVDRSLGWTADALQRWYGTPVPSLTSEQQALSATLLDVARGEPGVRALAAWSLGWDAARAAAPGDWMAPLLIELLDDEYSAIRYNAYRSLRKITGFADLEYDYVAPQEARWKAQEAARQRAARLTTAKAATVATTNARPELLFSSDGKFLRGELERLMAERPEDDEMFLAE